MPTSSQAEPSSDPTLDGLVRERPGPKLPRLRSRATRALPAAFIAGLVVSGAFGTPRTGIREDETQCEETVAHLAECCPSLDPKHYRCEHVEVEGCGGGTQPDFDIELSKKLRALECKELVAGNWCSYVPPEMTSANSEGAL